MEEQIENNKTESDIKLDGSILIDWVAKNSPEEVEEVKERIGGLNVTFSDEDASYLRGTNTISIPEDMKSQDVVHELVHVLSDRGQYESKRSGIRNLSAVNIGIESTASIVSSDEAMTELSTLAIIKDSKYIVNTPVEKLIEEYREFSGAEPGYIYATEYLLRKIKEANLNEGEINELVKTYLFKDDSAQNIKKEIEEKLEIKNLTKEIENYQEEKGWELLGEAWEFFKKESKYDVVKDKTFELKKGEEITFKEFFTLLEFSLEYQIYLRPYWRVNNEKIEWKKEIDKKIDMENDLYIDLSYLSLLMKRKNEPEIAKELERYILSKASYLYNGRKKEE